MKTQPANEKSSSWPWRQRIKNDLLYGLMRIAFAAAKTLPLRGPLRLVGCLAPYVFIPLAGRARQQLATAMPHLDAVKTTRRMFVHFAESLWELSRLHSAVPVLDDNARQLVDRALGEGKGAVVITGHIGNWELLGQAVAASGYPIATVAKPLYDPRITRWLQKLRTTHGLQLIWRDEKNAGKTILSVLRSNQLMAFLIDQNTKTAGDFIPFFGRPAFTPTVPAAIALRTGAPILFGWHHRHAKRHQLNVERIHYQVTGDRMHDIRELTRIFNERLEAAIRRAPEQWVWLHARWGRNRGGHEKLTP